MYDFKPFGKAINEQYNSIAKNELFRVGNSDEAWQVYLASFPEGSNPIHKVRTHHDCSCCRNFVKNLGTLVSIKNGEVQSVWDVSNQKYPYDVVAQRMADWVKNQVINGVFRTKENSYGAERTRQLVDESVITWNHFHGSVTARHHSNNSATVCGEYQSAVHVFQRGLDEILPSAIDTVLDLINQNSIYRGKEFEKSIIDFKKLQELYRKTNQRLFFVWEHAYDSAARIKNTVIGSLLMDLSEGVDLERAVHAFEAKVAPVNYKRPKSLITPRMIQDAVKTLQDENLESALERRFAKISDVSVNNVIFVDNAVRNQMKDGILELLMTTVHEKKPNTDKAIDITIDDFVTQILPVAGSIDVYVENSMTGNFVSITAPVHDNVSPLFKWDNNFAWSYDGNITDSIKERVKNAGGDIDAKFRVSLAWYNTDDLDIHARDPRGNHIYYANRMGVLDVDMNVSTLVRNAVENLSWKYVQDGTYTISVNNFRRRESIDQGFTLEVEFDSKVYSYSLEKNPKSEVVFLEIIFKNGKLEKITPRNNIKGNALSQEKWGVKTESFVKVNTIMLSPNYWDDNNVGNKHWFFILDGCKNTDSVRGIYNEFLNSKLEKHRKVFEILGDKTKCPPADDQLSGIGFSHTKNESLVVKTRNNQLYRIKF